MNRLVFFPPAVVAGVSRQKKSQPSQQESQQNTTGRMSLPLRNLRFAYISAFIMILFLATLAQVIVQSALFQGSETRHVSALLSVQSTYSQRLSRNAILMLTPTDHRSYVREMVSDLSRMQANRVILKTSYSSYYAELVSVNGPKAITAYAKVVQAAEMLIALEGKHLAPKVLQQQEIPWIVQMFYSENDQLGYITSSRALVDADIDTYIIRISLVEYLLYTMTFLTLCGEGLLVLRPSLKQFSQLTDLSSPTQQNENEEEKKEKEETHV